MTYAARRPHRSEERAVVKAILLPSLDQDGIASLPARVSLRSFEPSIATEKISSAKTGPYFA